MARPVLLRLAPALVFSLSFLVGAGVSANGLWRAPQATVSALAAAPRCLHWRVVGLCFWLHCTIKGCKVKVSVKVSNYAPDAFTTSFTSDFLLTDAAGNIEARKRPGEPRDHQIFRDADLYGHPLAGARFLGGLICSSRTVPLFPYFQSTLDSPVWRSFVPVESLYPAAWIPGLREIGKFPFNTWGSVYPRTGRVVQQEEPKAGAVIAQRVGDIGTRRWQPHVYIPLKAVKSPADGMKYWFPGPLKEGDSRTGMWQMFHPRVDRSCYTFGANDSLKLSSWSDGRRSGDGEYAFNLWRPYSCCRRRGRFLFSIP